MGKGHIVNKPEVMQSKGFVKKKSQENIMRKSRVAPNTWGA